MTDNDIIKALECCTTNGASCKDCPAFVKVDRSNCKKYFRGALDLINRQKAKIERSQFEIYELQRKIANCNSDILNEYKARIQVEKMVVCADSLGEWLEFLDEFKAEAIKEFAERLKNNLTACSRTIDGKCEYLVCDYEIDNLVREMVGDTDESTKNS